MLKSLYILVGGFLGAGKTTAVLQLARRLQERGQRVGLITNDQSIGLVDTALLRGQGFSTEEITGGCFCCKFNSLSEAASRLTAETRPDVFLAEPVGSCTDLRATVSYPLQRLYGDRYRIAPLSVLIDPIRARQVLQLDSGKVFSPKVLYIYEKQVEEADLLVINKCDLVTPSQLQELQSALQARFPQADILRMEARHGVGIETWWQLLQSREQPLRPTMCVDYDEYAEGEALLGWVNVSVQLAGPEFDGNALLRSLGNSICQRLLAEQTLIAHFKMTLSPDTGPDLAVANKVRDQGNVELSHQLVEGLEQGQLILNLRAEGDPSLLRETVLGELHSQAARLGLTVHLEHAEAFRPGRPTPTHRLVEV